MKIPDSVIEAVRDRADIVSVVGRHVALKRVGRNHVGLCPFHTEKSPSFSVSSDRRGYHCFGCGEGGDVFRFLCKLNNKSFPEVVRDLARDYGITIPDEPESPEERAREGLRTRLFALNERVVAWFREQLAADTGTEARAYLDARGLNPGLCAEFEVGYGGPGWDGLYMSLGKTEPEREDLLTLGLCVKGDNGVYDRFRGRVIFPIRDEKNRVVGFGGRVFGERAKKDGVAKYLNNSESPIYEKSHVFYRLPQALARIRRGEPAVIVEGYFDAIALERCGLAAMATCGTALTPHHAHHLKRMKADVVLCWDGDAAGDRAVRKAGEVLLPMGVNVRVASLPVGDDPDTYVERTGLVGAGRLVKEAEPLPKFVIQTAQRAAEDAGDDIPRRVAAIRSLSWLFHVLPAGLERDLYLDLAAKRLELARDQLLREFAQAAPRAIAAPVVTVAPTEQAPPPPRPPPPPPRLTREERDLCQVVAECPAAAAALEEAGVAEHLSAAAQQLLAAARDMWQDGQPPEVGSQEYASLRAVAGHPEIANIVDSVLEGRRVFDGESVEKAVRDFILRARKRQFEKRERELLTELQDSDRRGDREAAQRAMGALKELRNARSNLERGGPPPTIH